MQSTSKPALDEPGVRDWYALIEHQRPLVASVCQRWLSDPNDVDDAIQQTFLRFWQHRQRVHGRLEAWLAATARSVSVDLIRREVRERDRRVKVAGEADVHRSAAFTRELARNQLPAALRVLPDNDAELLRRRFLSREPLRVLADWARVDVSTMSRRVTAVLERLASVLREMGVFDADVVTVASIFDDAVHLASALWCNVHVEPDGLRMAASWEGLLQDVAANAVYLPGWSRPIRAGVFVGWGTISRQSSMMRMIVPPEWQVSISKYVERGPVELVGLIEPGTSDKGPVEATLRDYELNAGLIDATDAEALRTLDVISLGFDLMTSAAVLRAVCDAVQSGVGLHNEGYIGLDTIPANNPDLRAVFLSASDVTDFHSTPHGLPVPLRVVGRHPAVPSVVERDRTASACGPVYQPRADATTVLRKNLQRLKATHPNAPATVPALVCGELGSGRVVVNSLQNNEILVDLSALDGPALVLDLLRWLAEPRRKSTDGDGAADP
ncbi:MAG: sigma-70 family RNA polymerase sigma factor [Planctomycetota bacterium]